ncbi:hypothetical protein N865_13655 [Intrasporangium oryzae NRRL B-24470]|uniref:Uncharacterized protein n=1 Tax=Intrasporangium oryzae NRRL B-24470 TaxID=1386089 RepID=W9G660_9MICO|nr:hypothetical protein N865_13655 [Intrasporangium oryzae NRRL B-24470]
MLVGLGSETSVESWVRAPSRARSTRWDHSKVNGKGMSGVRDTDWAGRVPDRVACRRRPRAT